MTSATVIPRTARDDRREKSALRRAQQESLQTLGLSSLPELIQHSRPLAEQSALALRQTQPPVELAAPILRQLPRPDLRPRAPIQPKPKYVIPVQQMVNWTNMCLELDRVNTPMPDFRKPIHTVESAINDRLALYEGDIENLAVDVIVNAAKRQLDGGGGVDGAIHERAGPRLKVASMLEAPCEIGQAKITYGYELPALKVIHTVGPNISHGKKPTEIQAGQLKMCYQESLEVAT